MMMIMDLVTPHVGTIKADLRPYDWMMRLPAVKKLRPRTHHSHD
jgi:hypothetical protein